MQRPLLRRWLVLALMSTFVAFSFALFVAVEEAHAKGKSDGGAADRSGGGDSGRGDPIGDAAGGATKRLDGGGGGDRSGGGDLLSDGGGAGGGKKEGPLSDSPVTADKQKPALADTEPVTKKASGKLLDGASGETTDQVLSSEPILKTTFPTTDPTPTFAPAVAGTKDALERIARPISSEPVSTSETIQPLVEGVEEAAPTTLTTVTEPLLDEAERFTTLPVALVEGVAHIVDSTVEGATKSAGAPLVETVDNLASPIADPLTEATQQPLPLDDGAVAPIREALDPVLGNTAEPLLKPVDRPVLREVAPTTPLGDTLAAPTPVGQTPAAELYTPVSGGLPALSPTTGSEPETVAFEPAAAPVFELFVVGKWASLPVMEAVEASATLPPTVQPGVWSSVLEATESIALAPPLPAQNHEAAGGAAVAPREGSDSLTSLAIDAREVSTMTVLILHHRVSPLGTPILDAALPSWVKGFLRDAPSPFSPASLPVAGSAFGGFPGSGSGLGLGLLGALTLIRARARVNTLLRSAQDTFGASSYLQLAIERPG